MRNALFLYMAALAAGSPTAIVSDSSAAAATVDSTVFYSLLATATAAVTPNAAPIFPVSGNATEVVGIDASSVASAISSAVTAPATPSVDDVEGKTSSTSTKKTTSTSSYGNCKTKTSTKVITTAAPTSTVPASSTTSPYCSVPSSCTPVSWTNTNSYTSTTACPTAIEVGTYCGFINPLDPCAPQSAGSAPSPTADTVSAFLSNKAYQVLASQAATPPGYIPTFTDLDAAVSANTYLGYETLTSYDTASCAALCDATDLCTGFNIYIERDPGWNPDQCSCAEPASTYNFKCSIFAGGVYASSATNVGQYRDEYEVVITASNGYMLGNTTYAASSTTTNSDVEDDSDGLSTRDSDSSSPCLPDGASRPQSCWGKTHNHPDTTIKEAFFPGPFSIDTCISLATSQSELNLAADVNVTAAFVNAALVVRDGVAWGTYCGVFTQAYDGSECNWSPSSSSGHHWSVQDSWGVEIDVEVLLGA
ncbi:hypothetical protein BD289DRAFT_279959 [Coniella lustricola]|uniref:Apple domain-containing protein n=1 Tax=Coniella lustricola TaxID=2025994 RepID=A0A2T3A611_9PEZI|nr:hypothetical protein BD289DRAFT_279959 [Coniella lustricola]